ncbi:MAG: hypothetical protein U1F42_03180 [Candidatus Competibacteraceae bacterium]
MEQALRRPETLTLVFVLFCLVRFGVIAFGQTGQGQEFVTIPTAVVIKRAMAASGLPPIEQQGQVDQPAA